MSSFAGCLLAFAALSSISFDYGLDNTNIVMYDEAAHFSDYNRFRADLSLGHEEIEALGAKLILDSETLYSEHPSSLTSKGRVYRGYLSYEDEKNRLLVGRQRVPFGVGRLWNPIDVFNPVNSLAVETGERVGTESVRYEYSISDLSGLDLTVSRDRYAGRVKGFLEFGDVAVVGVVDNDRDIDIAGWELEGELFTSGITFRSEGGSFNDRNTGERHTELIAGLEYGFANSLTLLAEYYFNDEAMVDHAGWQMSYQPLPLWTLGALQIINTDDGSFFVSPTAAYSLADEMTVTAGCFIFSGDDGDEFGLPSDRIFLSFYVHF